MVGRKVDVNSRDFFLQTPLIYAAAFDHEASVKLLLDMDKIDIGAMDVFGMTALTTAAKNGVEAIVKLLLDTRSPGHSRSLLSAAMTPGHESLAK